MALTYWSVVAGLVIGGMSLIDSHVYMASVCILAAVALLIGGMWVRYRWHYLAKVVFAGVALVAFGVGGYRWVAYATAPSFPYIMPGPLFDPGQPSAFWDFLVVARGRKPIYNLAVSFQDMDQTAIVKKALGQRASPSEADRLLKTEFATFNYAELDPNTAGGNDNQAAQFYWRPGRLDDEHFNILLVHRAGTLRELLQVKNIAGRWQIAMRLTDERTHKALIECRDSGFPPEAEWRAELPGCFPKFPTSR